MKRIVAFLLLICLTCTLCGCGTRRQAAILCTYEAQSAGSAMAAQEGISCALAASDEAALQQLRSGAADYALVTEQAEIEACRKLGDGRVWLAAFCILTDAGVLQEWTKNTRVLIIGEPGEYGDVLAQQVLSCALHGTVRYAERQEALEAFEKNKADAVLGMIVPGDALVEQAVQKVKGAVLLPMPESLLHVELPHESMADYTLAIGEQSAKTYALPGLLVAAEEQNDPESEAAVIEAARKAGLLR